MLLFLLVNSCNSFCASQNNNNAIVTTDGKIKPISAFIEVLDQTVDTIRSHKQYDNLILFVHGRGKHPEKAFKKAILADLEDNYSAKVIMFHWPSWEGLYAFPIKNAKHAGADLSRVFNQLKQYKATQQEKLRGIKFTLLTNSMGSFVLEDAMLSAAKQNYGVLFDTIMINSPASSARKHAKWVKNINLSENIYISINRDDKLLGKAGIKLIGKRLGKGLNSLFGRQFKLADNVKYIDLTSSSLGHSYFLFKYLQNRPVAKAFYAQVLNGIPATLNQGTEVRAVHRERIYRMQKN
jgi:esterase/lipase superfamily enzyme